MAVSTPRRKRSRPPARVRTAAPLTARRLSTHSATFQGVRGNELLTNLTASVLLILLAAEAITVAQIEGLVRIHMFIGVLATVSLFATGVSLMVIGHVSDGVLTLHVISFVVWTAAFAIHLLSHSARVARSLKADWASILHRSLNGSGTRAMVLAAALGGGIALALSVLGLITGWHGGGNHNPATSDQRRTRAVGELQASANCSRRRKTRPPAYLCRPLPQLEGQITTVTPRPGRTHFAA